MLRWDGAGEKEIMVSRLSTTSVVCGPIKDNGPTNLPGQDVKEEKKQVESEGESGTTTDEVSFWYASKKAFGAIFQNVQIWITTGLVMRGPTLWHRFMNVHRRTVFWVIHCRRFGTVG